MRTLFNYGKAVPNQKHSVMTRPTAGLNEYLPSTEINDNNLSKSLDVEPYRNEALRFYSKNDTGLFVADTGDWAGRVLYALSYSGRSGENLITLLVSNGANQFIVQHDYNDDPYVTGYNITSLGLVLSADIDSANISGCTFSTEAKQYSIFTSHYSKLLVYFDGTITGKVALPFYPKKILAHANRIFILDTYNKIWWCRGGDFFTWYGLESDDDYITTSRNMANGAYALAAQPDVPRPIIVTITTQSTQDTLGTLTLVSTAYDGTAQTEVMTLRAGINISSKSVRSLTSATQAGHSAVGTVDLIKIGIAPIGTGHVTDDAGYWTFERENSLEDFCVLNGTIYIFAPSNIYSFSGYSPETFSSRMDISDVGIISSLYMGYHFLTTAQNMAYFIFNNDVYEFNGSDYPRIISRPLFSNGSVANNMFGSIAPLGSVAPAFPSSFMSCRLASDSNYVYIYMDGHHYGNPAAYPTKTTYYKYNIKERSWWYMSGISESTLFQCTDFRVFFLPNYGQTQTFSIMSNLTDNEWLIGELGYKNPIDGEPYIITKAFNTNPSEKSTVTDLILNIKSTAGATANLSIQYSISDSSEDFVELWSNPEYKFNGDLEQINISLNNSALQRVHHYRLKIIISLMAIRTAVYLYNIEQVYRIIGRTR